MGRPRKYYGETEKERLSQRVKAHREKIKLNNVSKTTAVKSINKAQKKYESKKKYERIETKEVSCNEILFLVKEKDSNIYHIFLRSFDPIYHKTAVITKSAQSELEARALFGKILNGDKENFWFSFDQMRDAAKGFIQSYNAKNENNSLLGYNPYSLRFIAMINEIVETDGLGPIRKGKKNLCPRSTKRRQNQRREILAFLPDFTFKKDQSDEEIKTLVEEAIGTIIQKTLENKKTVTVSSCKEKIDLFRDMIKNLREFPRAYNTLSLEVILITISESVNPLINCFKVTAHGVQEGLVEGDNNPFIPIKELKEILDKAWEKSTALYYFIILSLSVGGREEEMRRLVTNIKEYMLDDGRLDYNNTKRRKLKSTFLVQKTMDSTDITALSNPRLSIVSRMILLFENPYPFPSTFFLKKKGGFRTVCEGLIDYHERCLRTTAATMLAYCSKLKKQGASSFSDVSIRLGHTDMRMAMTVYAKKFPSDISPLKYFGVTPQTIIRGDYDLTKFSPLWDTFLLKDYLRRKEEYFKLKGASQEEINIFLDLLHKEAEFFNEQMDDSEENLDGQDGFDFFAENLKKAA